MDEQQIIDVCKILEQQRARLLEMGLKQAAENLSTAIEICQANNK